MEISDIFLILLAVLVTLGGFISKKDVSAIDSAMTDMSYVKQACGEASAYIFFYFLKQALHISDFSNNHYFLIYRQLDTKLHHTKIRSRLRSIARTKINPKLHAGVLNGFAKYADYRISLLEFMVAYTDKHLTFNPETEQAMLDIAELLNVKIAYFEMKESYFAQKKAEEDAKKYAEEQARAFFFGNSDYRLEKAYNLLNVSEYSSADEIKSAYRKIIKKWHPDKHINKSEPEIKTISDKFREYTEAYELIKFKRGIS